MGQSATRIISSQNTCPQSKNVFIKCNILYFNALDFLSDICRVLDKRVQLAYLIEKRQQRSRFNRERSYSQQRHLVLVVVYPRPRGSWLCLTSP